MSIITRRHIYVLPNRFDYIMAQKRINDFFSKQISLPSTSANSNETSKNNNNTLSDNIFLRGLKKRRLELNNQSIASAEYMKENPQSCEHCEKYVSKYLIY